jgi:pimeloyl-ACP methyl ester carboxylesterase
VSFLVVLGISVAVVLTGLVYQRVGAASDLRNFPPPGRLFETGDGQLHLNSIGAGSFIVIFEAGMASTSLSWSLVQPEIARIEQTASYDRFGFGWSDPAASTRDIEQVAREMHALRDRARLTAPLILVGHSYGGLVARAYAARYPNEVAGMVLVDPVAASEWSEPDKSHRKMLRNGIVISRFCGLLARVGGVRFLMNHWSTVARILPKPRKPTGNGVHGPAGLDRIVGEVKKLPREMWPMVQSHWSDPKCFDGMARYLEAFPSSAAAVAKKCPENDAIRNIPLIVLSAGNASPVQRAEHEDLARHYSQARLEIVADSGHWMHFDRPDVVISAIREMISLCRAQQRRDGRRF